MENLQIGKTPVSNWDKPGGKLGMVVVALLGAGGLMVLYKILPFLIELSKNIVTLAMLIGIIALIIFLVTDKKIRIMVSTGYFMLMRWITGMFVEIDPIAIVERRLLDMKKKIDDISRIMGELRGLIRRNKNNLDTKKEQFETELRRIQVYKEQNKEADAQVSKNQANRLDGVIQRETMRIKDSEKWYEVLSKLEEMAKLTVLDTENEITIRKEEFESIRQQHKAFKSVMSVMKGDPDEMALFTQAMDFMANDITAKIGEMEHVIDSTGGLLAQYSADNGVSSKKADELLEKYNKYGIEGMFKIVAIMVAVLGLGFGIYKATNKGGSDSSGKNDSGGGLFSSIGNSDVITISVNTYAGFTPIVWLNGGLEPNENSVIYKEFGLKLKINIQDDFGASRAAFKKGENDIVYCTTDVVCTEMGSGSDMTDARQFMILNKSRGADAIVVNKNIKTVADLAGKKIAFAPGTASHTLLINTLETNGISPDKIQMVKVGNGMDAAAAFKAGQVDAAVVWAPDDADLVATIPGSKVIVSTKQASELITDGLLAKADYLEKNKDKMTKLVSAILYANSLMNSDQATVDQAAKYFAKAFGTDEAFCINGCKNIHFTTLGDEVNFLGLNSSYTGTTADQIYSKMSRIYEGLGLTKSPLSWRKVSDTSIIEELVASGWSKGDQSAEGAKTFTAPTKEVENSAAISNKKLTIQFATGSNVVDGAARSMIDREFVSIAKQFASMRIRVEGNTDWTGDENYNKKLSYNRAKAVVDYLVEEYGFDKNRFVVKGNGSEHAINAGVKGSNADYRTTDFELIEE